MSELLLIPQAEPDTPPSGKGVVYLDDGSLDRLRVKRDDGTVVGYSPGAVNDTHASRLAAVPHAGQLWKESDTGVIYRGTGSAWEVFNPVGQIRKAADFTLPQTDTTANSPDNDIPGFSFPVEANEIWHVEGFFRLQGASTAADIKFDWTIPSGTIGIQRGDDSIGKAAGTAPNAVSTTNVAIGLINGLVYGMVFGYLFIGVTGGTAQLRAAQNTSTAEDVKVLANSLLLPRRIV